MRVLGAICLHYGAEYLEYAIKSIENHCDDIMIVYSNKPSYGYHSNLTNPDTREQLLDIGSRHGVIWKDVSYINGESNHRNIYQQYASIKGYDLVLVCDYDEVYNPDKLDELLKASYDSGSFRCAVDGSQWWHLWKTFNEANTDAFCPIRVLNMKKPTNTQETIKKGEIFHFGYAISETYMRYKISCHGHKADFDKNATWLNKWLHYERGVTKYLHPATTAYWKETEDFDKKRLPLFMRDHQTYKL